MSRIKKAKEKCAETEHYKKNRYSFNNHKKIKEKQDSIFMMRMLLLQIQNKHLENGYIDILKQSFMIQELVEYEAE